jgi:hypothetical protein
VSGLCNLYSDTDYSETLVSVHVLDSAQSICHV